MNKMVAVKPDYHDYIIHAMNLFSAEKDFLVFDLETTNKNFNPNKRDGDAVKDGRVMQIAALVIQRVGRDQFRVVEKFNELLREPTVKVDEDIHPGALKTHNIHAADLWERSPSGGYRWPTPKDAWTKFAKLAQGRVLVGQNILTFDIPLANREMEYWGLGRPLSDKRALDTLPVARHLLDFSHFQTAMIDKRTGDAVMPLSSGHKMANIATHLRISFDPTKLHDALYDIELCWKVWIALLPLMRSYQTRIIKGQPDQYKSHVGKIHSSLFD